MGPVAGIDDPESAVGPASPMQALKSPLQQTPWHKANLRAPTEEVLKLQRLLADSAQKLSLLDAWRIGEQPLDAKAIDRQLALCDRLHSWVSKKLVERSNPATLPSG